MPTVTTDGSRLLVALTNPNDPNQTANRLIVVDLDHNTTQTVYEGPGADSAFWARDDQTIIVIHPNGEDQQTVTTINASTGETTTIDNALPSDYFVITAR